MIAGQKVLAVIAARGGSKGIEGKNIRPLAGKPLIAWTIEAAKASNYIDRLILSSDSEDIIRVAKDYGCEVPFVRPKELAGDQSVSADVVLHALQMIPGYDLVVLLQPTSPLRTAADIDGCIARCVESGSDSCVSVVEVSSSPYWMYKMEEGQRLTPLLKQEQLINLRQMLPVVYELNGAVYAAKTQWFQENKSFFSADMVGYAMSPEHSVDIDTLADFTYAEFMLKEAKGHLHV